MERVKERLSVASRALATLDEALEAPKSKIVRDAAIQRFEYTFEAVWKAAQIYLKRVEGKDLASPKSVIRASFQAGLLDEAEAAAALQMVDDRNLTVHTYQEALAERIFGRLPDYARIMREWLVALDGGSAEAARARG